MTSVPASFDVARPLVVWGLPASVVRWTLIAGVATGVIYAMSPLTVLVAIALVPMCRYALRDLGGFERRAVRILLTAAIGLRVLAIAVLCMTADRNAGSFATFFGDEEFYLLRAFRLYSVWMGIPISTESFLYAYDKTGYTAYQDVLVLLQVLVGPAPYGIHVLNTLLFLSCSVWLYRVVRPSFGSAAALVGLAYLLFLPSLFIWSVSALKESLYLLMTSVALIAALGAVRAPSLRSRVAALGILLALGLWLDALRAAGGLITLGGAALAYGARAIAFRRWAIVAACAAVVVAGLVVWQRGLPRRLQDQLQASARYHRGHVYTPGHAYKLLDQRFYSSGWTPLVFPQMTPLETARYVVRGAIHFVAEPIPWRAASTLELAYMPELVIWYAVVLLAPVGFIYGLRRDALLTWLLACYGVLSAAVIALNSGNVGTLVRHRALIAPYLGWLAALGLVSLLAAGRSERSSHP